MKNLKYAFLLAVLPIAFNANAQLKPVATLKLDTALLKRQLKPQTYNFAPATNTPTAPASVVKTAVVLTPSFKFKSNVTTFQPGSIHPTPLPSTTFQPVFITSPGGTVSYMNSQGNIFKRN